MSARTTRLPVSVSALTFALSVGLLAGCGQVQRPDGGKGPLPVGAAAPAVTGFDVHEHPVSLADARGHAAVVYFYPADGTPGCTKEACAFRDAWSRFVDAGVVVIGVSANSTADHQRFLASEKLPFALAADVEHTVARSYGVSSGVVGDQRITFLVDREGRVARVFPDVDPGVHAEEVLAAARALP